MRTLAVPLLLLALAGDAAAGDGDATAARLLRRSRLAARIGDGYAFLFRQPLTDVLHPPQEGSFLYLADSLTIELY